MNNKVEKFVLEITPQACSGMFREFGLPSTQPGRLIKNPESIALLVFTGGHDVWPFLYGEEKGDFTSFSIERDVYESAMYDIGRKHNIPMLGICRGSQFLCVKSGGKLVQDVLNHAGQHHTIRTNDGRTLVCNSSHHQMQLPPESAIPLAWAEPRLSVDRRTRQPHYLNGDNENIDVERECEVVYYPNINALGVQGHPEWLPENHDFPKYVLEMTEKYLFKK